LGGVLSLNSIFANMIIKGPSFFLPNIEYFSKLQNAEKFVLDLNIKYTKQSFANRCYINGPHKIERLNVPIFKGSKYQRFSEVEISYVENWRQRNWRTIENCYRKAPFFEFYEPYFREILLESHHEKLYLLNNDILSLCLKLLQWNTTICHEISDIDHSFDIDYKKERKFSDDFTSKSYLQNFGNEFVPNLSIIDLLFCKGPESGGILNKSNPN
jgi:hypothetical protein